MSKLLKTLVWIWDHLVWMVLGLAGLFATLMVRGARSSCREAEVDRDKVLDERVDTELDEASKAGERASHAQEEAMKAIAEERDRAEVDADEALDKWRKRHNGYEEQ